jgi:dienelactone hydrolase
MAEVVLFHHIRGLTDGVRAFADDLRAAGHTVHTPDLFDGRTFETIEEGMAYEEETGWQDLLERGVRSADDLPNELVYAGFSFGVMSAQKLTMTRPGAKGGLFLYGAIPLQYFGEWPDGVPAQIHVMENDELGDLAEVREVAAAVPTIELFLYPGDKHLFADSTHADYDEEAATLLKERVLAFLEEVG